MLNYEEIEAKWQTAWKAFAVFEADVSNKEPYMVTAAFPYANAPQHMGHLRTFGTADVLARYERMKGRNVLYPMAFHATGTPVLAFAKRIANNDKELIDELKEFEVPDSEIKKMTSPEYIAEYFIREIKHGMERAGYSIDWRRSFVSTDAHFSKFIEWQFGILDRAGFITKGRHAIGWCPNENNAVGMHDTKHDVEPEIEAETVVKFKVEDENAYMLCTTFRPETTYGVTNIFVDAAGRYAICSMNGSKEQYYISKRSIENLKYQMKLEVLHEVSAAELLAKRCRNPVSDTMLPVLPGFFVKDDVGTGIVMSVPAHAPFDYAAIERLKKEGHEIGDMKPIAVLEIKGSEGKGIPAPRYISATANSGNEFEALEKATKLEYKEESHLGIMTIKGYEGMPEPKAREKIRSELIGSGKALELFAIANEEPVFCRCGERVLVKVVDDQWFLNYGSREWKEKTRKALQNARILPEKTRKAFESALEWINLRAVARSQGLGTKLPFDKSKIIESLSDSTIYMAFYTIAHFVMGTEPEKLRPEFFDYVFLGKGEAEGVSKATRIDFGILNKCRESFTYWYRQTSRHSGPDLIFNHLTMYIFNHVAVFDEMYWPKQIVVNGMVLNEGEKMSKSLGNIIPLASTVKKYGVDPLRLAVIAGADLFSDSDFGEKAVNGVGERFEYLYSICKGIAGSEAGGLMQIDYWLYSKLGRKAVEVAKAMENLELRYASTHLLYNTVLELKHYFARGGKNGVVLKDYISAVTLMLQPIAPHISEEFWHIIGNTTLASLEKWPEPDGSMISDSIEEAEDLVDSTISDAKSIAEIMRKKSGKAPSKIRVIVAEQWKREFNNALAENKKISKAIEAAVKAGAEKQKAERYAGIMAKKVNSTRASAVSEEEEYSALVDARQYMGNALDTEVMIETESKSSSARAEKAQPLKPSIDITS